MNTLQKLTGCFILVSLSLGLNAQTKNDAIDAFNQGVNLMKSDAVAAIVPFEECIRIAQLLGDSANDIKDKAIQVLPDLYYQKAFKIYSEKKLTETINACRVANSVADKYGNSKTKEKTDKLMLQTYIAIGTNYFKNNENENAIKCFDSALIVKPNNINAIYNKSLVYKKMNNHALFTETIDKYIELLSADNDTTQIGKAKKMVSDHFKNAGTKANQANKPAEAISLLNSSFKYGTDKDVYYQLANVYNKQKNFAEAIVNAQKGLEIEANGAPEAKAKFYYELAVAQAGKGEKDNACASFKNALYGPFMDASKAQMTNLKCK